MMRPLMAPMTASVVRRSDRSRSAGMVRPITARTDRGASEKRDVPAWCSRTCIATPPSENCSVDKMAEAVSERIRDHPVIRVLNARVPREFT